MDRVSSGCTARTVVILLCVFFGCSLAIAQDDYQGYKYEVEVEPLKRDAEVAQEHSAPTGDQSNGLTSKHGSYDEVPPTIYKLGVQQASNSESNGGSHYVLDLVVVLDSSYTITSIGWLRLKSSVKQLIDGLDISPQGTHVSIMKYSTDVEVYHMFDPNKDKNKLKSDIDKLTYDGEWSRLDMALDAVNHHVFSPVGGARLGKVPKAVVVFTDGKTDGPTMPDEEVNWPQKIQDAINSLRLKNINIFAVAAGVPNQAELEAIAGDPTRVYDMNSIDDLIGNIKDVSNKPTPPVVTVTVTTTVQPTAATPSLSSSPGTPATSLAVASTPIKIDGTITVTKTIVVTALVQSTPVATVVATNTVTTEATATETATTLKVTATETAIATETVKEVTTEVLTQTTYQTTTEAIAVTTTATQIVTLTTILGVTSTTYASASQTPIAVTVMGNVNNGRKRRALPDKRWYNNYIPKFLKKWMHIKD